jgi:thiol-disulfide isomerase/thioredoxin
MSKIAGDLFKMRIFLALAPIALLAAAPVSASGIRPFDNAAFTSAQAHSLPTIVFVHAPWCPICRAQEETIKKLLASPTYRNVTVFTIDYDTQKPLWTHFGVQRQSTLIGYHGARETARLSFDSDPSKVTAVVASTLR